MEITKHYPWTKATWDRLNPTDIPAYEKGFYQVARAVTTLVVAIFESLVNVFYRLPKSFIASLLSPKVESLNFVQNQEEIDGEALDIQTRQIFTKTRPKNTTVVQGVLNQGTGDIHLNQYPNNFASVETKEHKKKKFKRVPLNQITNFQFTPIRK